MRSKRGKPVAPADCGDYAANSDIEDNIEAEAEPLERYYHSLYYPIRIGEVLHNRYRIEHKLGWGGFSTVWLAQDMQRNVAVALKILVPGKEGQRELDIHNRIAARTPDSRGLLTCISSFSVRRGDHGNCHLVLVLPVRGPSLQCTYSRTTTPPALRMSAAKHVLLALRTLHDAGFIHRDLTLANIMWDIRPINHLTTAERYQKFGRPQKVAIDDTGDGKPGDLVAPIGKAFPKDLIQGAACIGDFGLTLGADDDGLENHGLGQPLAYIAPERLHGHRPSFASDVWSFMIVFANLYFGSTAVWGNGTGVPDRIVGLLGPFPKGWRELYDGGDLSYRTDWWYAGGGAIPQSAFKSRCMETLERKIERLRPEISAQERAQAISFIRRGLTYSPERRPTAAQLLEDPSFKALMGYYES